MKGRTAGNPILPGIGLCDPHVRVFDGRAWLYATHDSSPKSTGYVMEDWWVWSSADLVEWRHECTLGPERTYIGPGFRSCWATDAAERGGSYYWYLSEGNRRTAVVTGPTPAGPWRDPLGRPLLGSDLVPVGAYDPGVFTDTDGESYVVFGVWDFYIARLAEDMVSLAESPRRMEIIDPEGPYGAGRTDDKPYMHRRGGVYYLSWGCYYGMAEDVYGPYRCRGSFLRRELVDPALRYGSRPVTLDRHGSFFRWKGGWYFICNDMSRSGTPYFRDSSICRVEYGPDGEILPVRLSAEGAELD